MSVTTSQLRDLRPDDVLLVPAGSIPASHRVMRDAHGIARRTGCCVITSLLYAIEPDNGSVQYVVNIIKKETRP